MKNSKIVFLAIILVAAAIIAVAGLVTLLSKNSNSAAVQTNQPGNGLTVEKPAEVNVKIIVAIPIEPWVTEAAKKYNAENHKVDGSIVQVEVVAMDGLVALSKYEKDSFGSLPADADPLNLTPEQKKAVENVPTAWIADNRYLVEMANVPFKARLGRDVFVTDGEYRARPLAISPLVWGLYKSRADTLLKKYGEIDWHTIHDASTAKGGWAEIGGDPSWGFFKPVVPNPAKNIGGLQAMVAAAGEYHNDTRIDTAKVSDPGFQQWLGELMGAVTDLGSSSYSAEDFALFGYSSGDGGLMLESDLLRNMEGIANRWNETMYISYPKYLTWDDFPFAVWVGPETTALQKNSAIDFQKYLLSEDWQKKALAYGLRPASASIKVDATPDSLFVKWAKQGISPVIPRSTSMKSPDRDVLTTLMQWYRLNILNK